MTASGVPVRDTAVTHFPELRCPVCTRPADQVVQTLTGYVDACLEHTAALASGEVSL